MKKKLLLLSLLLLTGCGSAAPAPEATPAPTESAVATPEPTAEPTSEESSEEIIEESESKELHWVLNTKSKKIHHEGRSCANDIKEDNKEESDLTIEELENEGYTKCGNCFK